MRARSTRDHRESRDCRCGWLRSSAVTTSPEIPSCPLIVAPAAGGSSSVGQAIVKIWNESRKPARPGADRPGRAMQAQVVESIGGGEGDRTLDLRIANATLSQLSYSPEGRRMVAQRPANPSACKRTSLHKIYMTAPSIPPHQG